MVSLPHFHTPNKHATCVPDFYFGISNSPNSKPKCQGAGFQRFLSNLSGFLGSGLFSLWTPSLRLPGPSPEPLPSDHTSGSLRWLLPPSHQIHPPCWPSLQMDAPLWSVASQPPRPAVSPSPAGHTSPSMATAHHSLCFSVPGHTFVSHFQMKYSRLTQNFGLYVLAELSMT